MVIFLPPPPFLYFKRMAMGVSWGKRCQQNSWKPGSSGEDPPGSFRQGPAVILERNCWLLYIIRLLSCYPFLPPGLSSPLINPLCSEKILLIEDSDSFV